MKRRRFNKLIAAGSVGAMNALSLPLIYSSSRNQAKNKTINNLSLAGNDYFSQMKPNPSNVKIGFGQFPTEPDDDLLTFTAQFGVKQVACWTSGSNSNAEYFKSVKDRFARYGISPL
jgi:hypothetical protein